MIASDLTAGDSPQETEEDSAQEGTGDEFPDAASVVALFGGVRPMAATLGLAATTIQGWKSRGNIPPARRQAVREAAATHGIDLTAAPVAADGGGDEGDADTPRTEPEITSPPTTPSTPPPASAPAGRPAAGVAWLALVLVIAVAAAMATQPLWAPVLYGTPEAIPADTTATEALAARLASLEDKTARTAAAVARVAAEKPANPANAVDAAAVQALAARLDALSRRVAAMPDPEPRLAALESALDGLRGSLDALSARVRSLDARVATLATRSDLAAQSAAVAALRKDVTALSARLASAGGRSAPAERAAALVLAVGQLEDTLRGGAPYGDALAVVRRLAGADAAFADSLAILAKYAKTGAPALPALQRRFADIAPTLGRPPWKEGGEGWVAAALRKIDSVITVRRIGGADGVAPAVRAERALAAGDLAGAVAALDGATASGKSKDALARWIADAKARLAVTDAVAALRRQAIGLLGDPAATKSAPE